MAEALVIGASGGMGSALGAALEARGDGVTRLSRSGGGLDVTEEGCVAAEMGALEGPFDLILVATGALDPGGQGPEKSLSALAEAPLLAQFRVNAIGPALVLKHAVRLFPKGRRCVFAALSARVGSIGDNRLGGWYGYRASKAALNQIVHGAAVELRRSHPQAIVLCLHPGTVATAFTAGYDREKVAPGTAARNLLSVIDAAKPEQSGGFFDYAGREIPW